MKLTLAERVALLNVLPPEGNIVTLRIVKELQAKLGFQEEELKKYRLKIVPTPDGSGRANITWDPKAANVEKEFQIGDAAKGIIQERLRVLDQSKALQFGMLSLWDKFMDGKGTDTT